MTEAEMNDRIQEEQRNAEKEKERAISRTILSVVGIVGGIAIIGNSLDSGAPGQWGGVICIVLMVFGLVWLHNKIVGD